MRISVISPCENSLISAKASQIGVMYAQVFAAGCAFYAVNKSPTALPRSSNTTEPESPSLANHSAPGQAIHRNSSELYLALAAPWCASSRSLTLDLGVEQMPAVGPVAAPSLKRSSPWGMVGRSDGCRRFVPIASESGICTVVLNHSPLSGMVLLPTRRPSRGLMRA